MCRQLVAIIVHLFFVVLSFDSLAAAATSESSQPNIVLIVADDLGWNCVGYHNQQYQTPNIDRIVSEGVELNRFYVAPMCSPTRAGLMTGRYPIRFGCARSVIPPYRDFGLPVSELTLPERLADLGYQNRGTFGKWHLGHRRAKWHPLNQGFTHFHGHYNGAIDYFQLTREGVRDWHVNDQPSDQQGYSTRLIAEAASEWIAESASADSPYFCYVPFNAPHGPLQAPEETIANFARANQDRVSAKRRTNNKKLATLKAMILEMDEGIGRILQTVEESGESDNTLVWFLSDNGGVGSLPKLNKPLRGSKLTVYEGGIRVPACVRWPSKFPAGGRNDRVCGYIDVMPTLVDAASGSITVVPGRPIDGISLLASLESSEANSTASTKDDRPWYSYHGQSSEDEEYLAVTADGWKLTVVGPRLIAERQLQEDHHRIELFQLASDPYETTNVASQHPSRVEELGRMLIQHRALQPLDGVPTYEVGREGFIPPPNWQLDFSQPDALVGSYKNESE
ncbi:sulfatase-like hydrolase/transferase [Bythopirellula polymerisocia]|uniref:Arylsulfatase n=1 Tax=Bythopirellula polymerisocia TaxID=2528003 RepID=A0A5C6D2H3_9BACT|nr:sulfatase-like hydrolase/transferase [Bythopirellula polymerisocia]TWU29857.1 Arylsulfatase [Bythopirellula polymerisocia]